MKKPASKNRPGAQPWRPAGRPGHVPLERALSKLGIASRTQARAWILEGRVRIGGQVMKDPSRLVVPETAKITVDDARVEAQAPRTIAFHKPKGVITTASDEKGRPTVFSLLEGIDSHLVAVGRLDAATTGLLLLTNDTRFAAWVTDPVNAVPRVYIVTVREEVTDETARQLEQGVVQDGERLGAARIEIRKASKRESHLTIELTEGKNREIRRLLGGAGHEVTRLKRISFGGIALGDLPPGRWRELSPEELAAAFPGVPLRPPGQTA